MQAKAKEETGMVDEQPKQDEKPPNEPGLESEGIGPIGLIVGGVLEGPVGVAAAWVGEKLIDIPGAYSEWNKAEEDRRHAVSDANMAGYEHGLGDGMNQSSSPVPPQYSTGPDEGTTGAFNRGEAEGTQAAEDIRARQAGAADGQADAERQQSSPAPDGYAGIPGYEKAYEAAREASEAGEG
jgi:hypothetical protein